MLIKAESLLFLLPLLTLVVAPMSQRRVTDEMKPGPPAAPGSPWPPGWAAAPASWLSSPAARVAAHFLAGTSDSGTVTWQRSHVTGARRSPNWQKGKRQRRGGGRGATGRGRRAAPGRLPLARSLLRLPQTLELPTPPAPHHPKA